MTPSYLLGAFLVCIGIIVVLAAGFRYLNSSKTDDESESFEAFRARPVPNGPYPAHQSANRDYRELLPSSFVVLDLETTGLDPDKHEIIEIGAIRAVTGSTEHLAFQTLVKPTRRIPAKITSITGITQAMVDADGVPLAEALAQFLEFIGDLPLVTYNAEFDMGFLWAAARQSGISLNNSYTCALKRARRAWPGLPSYRLSELAKRGNLNCDNAHRAVADCERALIVFVSATSVLGKKVRWSRPKELVTQ